MANLQDNQKRKTEDCSGPGWIEILLLLIVFSVATLMINKYVPFFSPAVTVPKAEKVVFIDTKPLFASMVDSMKQRINHDNPDSIMGSGMSYANKLNGIVQSYVDKGYIVLHSRNALSFPPGKDITNVVAKQLGIVLPLTKEVFREGLKN
jgi:hypothetical protein